MNKPTDKCPFIERYEQDHEDDFCDGCLYLIRNNEYDRGHNKNDWQKAYVCKKDAMEPEICFEDYEEPRECE